MAPSSPRRLRRTVIRHWEMPCDVFEQLEIYRWGRAYEEERQDADRHGAYVQVVLFCVRACRTAVKSGMHTV